MNPNNRSIASSINQFMHSDPRRFAQWMNSGMCLGTLNQAAQDGIDAQQSLISPHHANYNACVDLGEIMGEANVPRTYQCRYDRERARQYALRWGSSDAFKNATLGMNVGGGTDCANFASQVLAAGGFRPTNNWNYWRSSNGYIQEHTQSWTSVNCLLAWLTGENCACTENPNGSSNYQDMTPMATSSEWVDVRVDSYDSVLAAARRASNLEIGDLIFYYDYDSTPYDHVAVVVGWGMPQIYDSSVDFLSADRVPWIVDHGASPYPEGRRRPYNRHDPYVGTTVGVKFVHIPDSFRLHNIRGNGLWQ